MSENPVELLMRTVSFLARLIHNPARGVAVPPPFSPLVHCHTAVDTMALNRVALLLIHCLAPPGTAFRESLAFPSGTV